MQLLLQVMLDAGKLSDPSWIMLGVMGGIGLLGLLALVLLYPLSKDD